MPYDPNLGLNADLTQIGVTGGIAVAPLGTAGPTTDWLGAWPVGFKTIGYVGPDGISAPRGEEREDYTPWQSASPIRSQVTSTTKTFGFEAWESNFQVVSLYYQVDAADMTVGATATANAGIVTFDEKPRPVKQRRAFGIDVLDGGFHHRYLIPNGEITERGDLSQQTSSIISYPLIITAYESAGVSVRHWMRVAWTPGS